MSPLGVKVTAWRKVHRSARTRSIQEWHRSHYQEPTVGCPCNDKKKPKPKGGK